MTEEGVRRVVFFLHPNDQGLLLAIPVYTPQGKAAEHSIIGLGVGLGGHGLNCSKLQRMVTIVSYVETKSIRRQKHRLRPKLGTYGATRFGC
jgi:hypothetical protein